MVAVLTTPLGNAARRFLGFARDLQSDQSGAAAVVIAIVFPILVGGMGLGAETGYWYVTQRKLQHAVDVPLMPEEHGCARAIPRVKLTPRRSTSL
jgi:Putative Flp pilus-assembly TadE/G-like